MKNVNDSSQFDHLIYVRLTEACNMKCDHCFIPANPKKMSLEDCKNIPEIVSSFTKKGEKIILQWHGGEPTLFGINLFKKVLSYLDTELQDRKVIHGIQTNLANYTGFDFKYGNLDVDSMETILSSDPLKELTLRMHQIDPECAQCEFYYACRGGCGALSQLNKKVGDGRYPYCATNKIVFGRIKQLDQLGRTEELIEKAGTEIKV